MIERANVEYQLLRTPWGWLAAAYSSRGILALTLPVGHTDGALVALRGRIAPSVIRGHGYGELARDLDRYFQGEAVSFGYPLDLTRATPYQLRVWAALREIPYGATRSYGEVARSVGMPRAVRAVGQAVGANPIPLLIPCHRVVAPDGSFGGYAWDTTWKHRLLQVEGVSPPSVVGPDSVESHCPPQ